MQLASTLFLAFAMSTDAFAAAIGKGATLNRPRFADAIRIGALFGLIEAITPVIGWTLGILAAGYIAAWDHWVAFVLLCFLGIDMIRKGLRRADDATDAKQPPRSLRALVLTAIATSIDAMAVGVSLAFIDVAIIPTAIAIGLATMLMVTIGIMLGRVLGSLAGHRAEIAGGVILIGIGCTILFEHL